MADATVSNTPASGLGGVTVFSLSDSSQALDFWREFDLDGRRLALDKTCVEMKDMKSNSIAAKKKLNESTKSFRSKAREEQLTIMPEILREYQEEIDSLSKRAKFSENAFYGLYKALYEAPDPAVIIEQMTTALSNSSTHLLEIERLKGELSQYDEEFQQLKNQDITIRRLEEQLQEYKDKIEDKVAEEVRLKAVEIEELAEAKIAEVKEVQRAAERRLAAGLESMRQAQASADRAQSQLFEVSSQAESRISALQAENSILAESAQRSNARIAELESALQQPFRMPARHSGDAEEADERAITQLLVADLRAELHRRDEAIRADKVKNESILRDTSALLAKERETTAKLKQELAERPAKEDFIALKRQLKVLQRAVFNIHDDDTEDSLEDTNPEITQLAADKVQFEVLLTSKLKSLEGELAEARRNLLESRDQEKLAKSTAAALKTSLEASSALVQRLEADLELRTGKVSRAPLVSSTDPTLGLAELLEDRPTTGETTSKTLVATDGQSQLVGILQAQRDRYKERLGQVESSLSLCQQQLDAVTAAKGQLEADNLSLYSKIRFLQSYSTASSGKPVRGMKLEKRGAAFEEEFGFGSSDMQREVEHRYQNLYEQGISPFQEFSQFEKQRKLNELSVADRIVLNTTMAFVSSHAGRSFLLVYLCGMHLLVFATLYYSAHSVQHGCDPAIDHLLRQQQQIASTAASAIVNETISHLRRLTHT